MCWKNEIFYHGFVWGFQWQRRPKQKQCVVHPLLTKLWLKPRTNTFRHMFSIGRRSTSFIIDYYFRNFLVFWFIFCSCRNSSSTGCPNSKFILLRLLQSFKIYLGLTSILSFRGLTLTKFVKRVLSIIKLHWCDYFPHFSWDKTRQMGWELQFSYI